MKTLLIATFVAGLLASSIGTGQPINIELKDIAHQDCTVPTKAKVVFFNTIFVEHPLGNNTCGNLHAIKSIGYEG